MDRSLWYVMLFCLLVFHSILDEKNRPTQLYTLSVNPNGTRLATGGVDRHIRIWHIPTLLQEAQNGEESTDAKSSRILATLSRHSGSILCLKWSPKTGRYLASSSDDCKIFIWKKKDENNSENLLNSDSMIQNNPAFSPFVIGGFNIEQYIVSTQLQGHHASDINGLAWTIDEQYLASCSLDGKAIVYRVTFPSMQKIHQLDCNIGGLKGIAWDPFGKYLAIQADHDPGLLIYRSNDWQQIQVTLSKQHSSLHEHHKSGATFFARPSWSPDGQYLAISNGINNDIPVVSILQEQKKQRKSLWEAMISFVGHQYPIEVVSFNPLLFNTQGTDESQMNVRMYCAVGSQDKGISIWRNDYTRPIVVIQDLFQHAVLDMDWIIQSNKLHGLAITSMDGTVAVCIFNVKDELGTILSDTERDMYLNHYHDMRESTSLSQKLTDIDILPESALELPLNNDLLDKRCENGNSDPLEPQSINQPVLIDKNGIIRKRLQPTLIIPTHAIDIEKPVHQSRKHHSRKKIKKPLLSSFIDFKMIVFHLCWNDNPFVLRMENTDTETKGSIVSLINTNASFQVWKTNLKSILVIKGRVSIFEDWIVLGIVVLKHIDNDRYQSGILLLDIKTGIAFSPPWILDSPILLQSDKTLWIGVITQSGTMYIWDINEGKLCTKVSVPDSIRSILNEYKLDSLSSIEGDCHWPLLHTLSKDSSWLFHIDLQVWIPWQAFDNRTEQNIEISLSERLGKRLLVCHDKQKRQDNIEQLEQELFSRIIQMKSSIAAEQDLHDLTRIMSKLLSSLQREPNSETRIDYWINQLLVDKYGTKGQLIWLNIESRKLILQYIKDSGLIKH